MWFQSETKRKPTIFWGVTLDRQNATMEKMGGGVTKKKTQIGCGVQSFEF